LVLENKKINETTILVVFLLPSYYLLITFF